MCVYACECVCICSEDILHGQRAGQLGGRFEELAKMPEKVRRDPYEYVIHLKLKFNMLNKRIN